MKKTESQPRTAQEWAELVAQNQKLNQQMVALERELVERRQAEELMRGQQEELRDLVENASIGIHQVGPEGKILWANQAELDLLGYTREEYLGHHIAEFHADQAIIEDILQRLQQGETLHNYEAQLRRRDGSVIDVLISSSVYFKDGNFIHTRCFTKDVTAYKQIDSALRAREEQLRQSEAQARHLILALPVALYTTDAQGRVTSFNDRAVKLWGRSPEIGKDLWCGSWRIFRPDGEPLPLDQCPMAVALREGRSVRGEEILIERPDGTRISVLPHPEPLRDATGRIIGAVNMLVDITERKRNEQEREQLLRREQEARTTAEAANRAKDEFLAVVSHELRAPLNAMLGWAKILKGGKYKPETLTHAVEVIERSARSQQQLIEDLLDSARIISGKLRLETQVVDLTMVIEAALDIVRPAAEAKSIGLETSYQAETDVITGDPERLQQVIWNLLSNAVKFTPEGGQVSVQVERVDPHLQVTVKDTGKGISRDFLPHVFDRFHQADSSSTRRHGGLGLGLALVRHLVELHGGTVSADSPGEGQGTSFIIHLPLRAVRATINEAEAPEANRNVGFHLPPALEGLRILLVDDEADARDLVALMLEQQGAEVEATSSAREALAVLTKGQQPDVIVSDIGMPDEDGYALIRQVRALPRAQGRPIPAVALTAYGRASDRIAALSAGFQMHVPKPVEPTELIMVIAGLTGRVGKGMNA